MISTPVSSGNAESCCRTFLKTMASSSHTGLMALPCDVLVLNAFLLVSTGKPNMSISTQVPTFLSDRNWPEMILKEGIESKNEEKTEKERKKRKHSYGRIRTFTESVLATIPSTVLSAKGSKCLSVRLMNSGLSLQPDLPLYSYMPRFNCMDKSEE